jgi:hypothetical protein
MGEEEEYDVRRLRDRIHAAGTPPHQLAQKPAIHHRLRGEAPSSIRTVPSAPEFHRVMLSAFASSSRAIPPIGNWRATRLTLP